MNNFIILILVHFVSDWIFQPVAWAEKKTKDKLIRLYHSIQYALMFLPVLMLLNISLFWLLYLLITHFVIDSYVPVSLINKLREIGSVGKTPLFVVIVQDQIIHIMLLIPLAL